MSDTDNDCVWDDENGIKKIKKMAEVTGLSQSQVYKWCCDQKKKNIKSK